MYLELIIGGGVVALIIGLVVWAARSQRGLGKLENQVAQNVGTAESQTAATDAMSKLPDEDAALAEMLAEAEARDRLRAES